MIAAHPDERRAEDEWVEYDGTVRYLGIFDPADDPPVPDNQDMEKSK